MKLEFGYLPQNLDTKSQVWSISTLPDLQEKIVWVNDVAHIRSRWYYPGSKLWKNPQTDEESSEPFPNRVFSLPMTHILEVQSSSDADLLKFMVWVLSFFKGMRLTTEARGFLDSTPTEIGMLVDFIPIGNIEKTLNLADVFWNSYDKDTRQAKRFSAALHAFFVSKNPQLLQFERFNYLYAALDACFAILNAEPRSSEHLSHARRIEWMCAQTQVPCPIWAMSLSGKGGTEVSTLRNDVIHEALFFGEPLGFAVEDAKTNRNLTLEMGNLVCRLLAAIIGVLDKVYLSAPTDIRARHALLLEAPPLP